MPVAFVPRPYGPRIELNLNNEIMQNESTSDRLFNMTQQIESTSRRARFLPGGLISLNTPLGTSARHHRFIPADVIEGTISGLGMQRTHGVAEEAA